MSIARPARNCGPTPRSEPIFATWRAGFERRAAAAGITPDTLASARPYLRPLPDTLALDRRQSEFGARVWEYLDSAVNAERIRAGRAAMARHKTTLDRIESRFGVPPEIVAAIWGIETSYGANRRAHPHSGNLGNLGQGRAARGVFSRTN